MVYRLPRTLEHEALRQGAYPMPASVPLMPQLYPDPVLVWGADLPDGAELTNAFRGVELTVHNAGSACRLDGISSDAPWLLAPPAARDLPGDGRPVSLWLRFVPSRLAPGRHEAVITVSASWPGGGQRLTHRFVLTVPDGPIPWFEDLSLRFDGPWPRRQVAFVADGPVRVLYGEYLLHNAEPNASCPLYPAEYRLDASSGGQVTVLVDRVPCPASVPGTLRVPGPVRQTRLRNLGARPFAGRLTGAAPWLRLPADTLEVAPGDAVTVAVECYDDGRHWPDVAGQITLRGQFQTEPAAVLFIERDCEVEGPRPVVAASRLLFPPTTPGGTSTVSVGVRNEGRAPFSMKGEHGAPPVRIPPGGEGSVSFSVGPPRTEQAGKLRGELSVLTNGELPFWRFLTLPYECEVVGSTLESVSFDFGTVRYMDSRYQVVRAKRTDFRRSRLAVEVPDELQDVLCIQGGNLLYLRNIHPRPVKIDGEFPIRDEELGVELGRIHVRGQCLVPRLEIVMERSLRLVPGQRAEIRIQMIDAGGGLEVEQIKSGQPWARIRRSGLSAIVRIETGVRDRGVKEAVLTFRSNDFVNPVQERTIQVVLAPTLTMRVLDIVAWCLGPVWRPVRALIDTLRGRR